MIVAHLNFNTTEQERRLPLYVTTVGYTDEQSDTNRPMGLAVYQLLYTRKGKGLVELPQGKQIVSEGQVLLLPPFSPHKYGAYEGSWETCWVTYAGSMARACFPFSTDVREQMEFLGPFESIMALCGKKDWRRRTSAYLYEMLLSYSEAEGLCEMGMASVSDVHVDAAVEFISEHYCETIELSMLAHRVGLSEGHFCRVFREYTHMRPIEYITHLRIELAKSILKEEPHATVTEIAERVGYDRPGYFSYVFRKSEGCSPMEYRMENRMENRMEK